MESEPDRGAVFTVYLPLHEGDAFEEEVSEDPLPRGDESVLLVDDDKALLESCRRMLTYLGYQVDAFFDPNEALHMIRKSPESIDLLVILSVFATVPV